MFVREWVRYQQINISSYSSIMCPPPCQQDNLSDTGLAGNCRGIRQPEAGVLVWECCGCGCDVLVQRKKLDHITSLSQEGGGRRLSWYERLGWLVAVSDAFTTSTSAPTKIIHNLRLVCIHVW